MKALMKRAVLTAVVFGSVAALSGCPIYNHEDEGCFRDKDCGPGYLCDDESGACYQSDTGRSCSRPSDCGQGQTCASSRQCVAGDCSFSGCVRGYVCDGSSGIWSCIQPETGAGGAPDPGTGAAGSSGAAGEPNGTAGEANGTAGEANGTAGEANGAAGERG